MGRFEMKKLIVIGGKVIVLKMEVAIIIGMMNLLEMETAICHNRDDKQTRDKT